MQDAFAKFRLSALAVEPPILLAVSVAEKPKTLRITAKTARPSVPIPQPKPVEELHQKQKLDFKLPMSTPFQQASQRTDSFEMVGNSSELGEGLADEQSALEENQDIGPSSATEDQPVSTGIAGEGECLALLHSSPKFCLLLIQTFCLALCIGTVLCRLVDF